MSLVLPSDSLVSFIAALGLSHIQGQDVYVKKGKLKHYDRYYSINAFSKSYLDDIGIWSYLDSTKIVPYSQIDIFLNDIKSIEFSSQDLKTDHLGYIVHEGNLVDALSESMSKCNKLKYLDDQASEIENATYVISDITDVKLKGIQVDYEQHDYHQTALNLTLVHTKTNKNQPIQIFYENEILGLLPINEFSYNLIWSLPNAKYNSFKSITDTDLANHLSDRISFIVGAIDKIERGKSFTLSSRHANKYFHENNVLIGEAAHKFHPLAGLGLNMGIEDIAILSFLLSSNKTIREVLNDYALKRINRNQSLQRLLDIIMNFHSSKSIPAQLKSTLLRLFDNTMLIKPKIIENATGLNNLQLFTE